MGNSSVSALYLCAVRALPEEYISDDTRLVEWRVGPERSDKDSIVAAHPDLPALLFHDGKWEKIEAVTGQKSPFVFIDWGARFGVQQNPQSFDVRS